jgi:hypothetical protein
MGKKIRTLFVEPIFHNSMMKTTETSTNRFQVAQEFWLWNINRLSSELCTCLGRLNPATTRESKTSKDCAVPTSCHQVGFGRWRGGGNQKSFACYSITILSSFSCYCQSYAGSTQAFWCLYWLHLIKNFWFNLILSHRQFSVTLDPGVSTGSWNPRVARNEFIIFSP